MKKKKEYTKPQLGCQKMELGVYGNYNNGDGLETRPADPVRSKDLTGDGFFFT
jgi:hypothetical protein